MHTGLCTSKSACYDPNVDRTCADILKKHVAIFQDHLVYLGKLILEQKLTTANAVPQLFVED